MEYAFCNIRALVNDGKATGLEGEEGEEVGEEREEVGEEGEIIGTLQMID